MESFDRAQSHTVGVILLTAVIVILIGVFGAVYLGVTSDRADRYGPLLDAEVNATDEQVFLTHRGGDSIAVDELAVTIRRGGTSERHALAVADVTRTRTLNDVDRFEPTERFEHAHDLGAGQMEVMVIHVPSNTVLHQEHLDVVAGSGTPTVASFEYTPAAPEPGIP